MAWSPRHVIASVGFAGAVLWLAVALWPTSASGELDQLDAGPPIGANVADLLSVRDQTGKHQSFRTLASGRGLVLMFSRSLVW